MFYWIFLSSEIPTKHEKKKNIGFFYYLSNQQSKKKEILVGFLNCNRAQLIWTN